MYKWMAFTEEELKRLLYIVDNSDITTPSDVPLYKKIKKVAERKE